MLQRSYRRPPGQPGPPCNSQPGNTAGPGPPEAVAHPRGGRWGRMEEGAAPPSCLPRWDTHVRLARASAQSRVGVRVL